MNLERAHFACRSPSALRQEALLLMQFALAATKRRENATQSPSREAEWGRTIPAGRKRTVRFSL